MDGATGRIRRELEELADPAYRDFHAKPVPTVDPARILGVRTPALRSLAKRLARDSLAIQTVCPQCGAVGVKINRQTGMCPLCTERYHLEQERAFNEQLERERAHAEESTELEEVRRERDMMRQRNSRLCRKYGLKGRRERKK